MAAHGAVMRRAAEILEQQAFRFPASVYEALCTTVHNRRGLPACQFCGRTGVKARCAWPVKQWRTERADSLIIGDHVRSVLTQKRCRVVSIDDSKTWWRRYHLQFPDRRVFEYSMPSGRRVEVERPGVCGAPCCFACRRNVGPGRVYCSDHWHAWQEV